MYKMCCEGVLEWEKGEKFLLENMSNLKQSNLYHELMILLRVRLAACFFKGGKTGESLRILVAMLAQQGTRTDSWLHASDWAMSSLCKGLQVIYFELGQIDEARYYAERAQRAVKQQVALEERHCPHSISNYYRAERLCRTLGDYEAANRACLGTSEVF
jgi:hypothetical protein